MKLIFLILIFFSSTAWAEVTEVKFQNVNELISRTKELQKGKLSISPTFLKNWSYGEYEMELPYSELVVNDFIVCYDYDPDGFDSKVDFLGAGFSLFKNGIEESDLSFCEVSTKQTDGSMLVVTIQDELTKKIKEKKIEIDKNSILGTLGVEKAISLYKARLSFSNFEGLFSTGNSGEEFIRVREWTEDTLPLKENYVYKTSIINNTLSCFELNTFSNRELGRRGVTYIPRAFCVTEIETVADNQ